MPDVCVCVNKISTATHSYLPESMSNYKNVGHTRRQSIDRKRCSVIVYVIVITSTITILGNPGEMDQYLFILHVLRTI
jgi:hypothetical protein